MFSGLPFSGAAMGRSLDEMRVGLYAAVVADALDKLGFRNQSPQCGLRPLTVPGIGAGERAGDGTGYGAGSGAGHGAVLVGRCRTTLWADMAHEDPQPYELELQAVDACQPGDVLIAAAGGSMRSGIWGELLTTAARNGGCAGAIVDGAVRDVVKISRMHFPVFARGTSVYDSLNRQRVIDLDVPVEIGGVRVEPGDLVIADWDGVVFVPAAVEAETLELAFEKVSGENTTRDAIAAGMKAGAAFRKFGVL
jgi:4-hydroxy-4-methyl-2-oxoglutarate aldolase